MRSLRLVSVVVRRTASGTYLPGKSTTFAGPGSDSSPVNRTLCLAGLPCDVLKATKRGISAMWGDSSRQGHDVSKVTWKSTHCLCGGLKRRPVTADWQMPGSRMLTSATTCASGPLLSQVRTTAGLNTARGGSEQQESALKQPGPGL
ncbi:MAG: hypothetical protein RLZZ232_2685 [Planctomycetota bacterium]